MCDVIPLPPSSNIYNSQYLQSYECVDAPIIDLDSDSTVNKDYDNGFIFIKVTVYQIHCTILALQFELFSFYIFLQ